VRTKNNNRMCLAPYGGNLKGAVDVPDVLLLF